MNTHADIWHRVNADEIHPDLKRVISRAARTLATEHPILSFVVTEGARTKKRQEQLVASGASRTLKSRHIAEEQPHGKAEAVDLAALVAGQVRWDWPLYKTIADAVKQAADEIGIPIEWGGDWKTFKDGPHFQLKR